MPVRPTRAVCHAVSSAHAYWVLVGAGNSDGLPGSRRLQAEARESRDEVTLSTAPVVTTSPIFGPISPGAYGISRVSSAPRAPCDVIYLRTWHPCLHWTLIGACNPTLCPHSSLQVAAARREPEPEPAHRRDVHADAHAAREAGGDEGGEPYKQDVEAEAFPEDGGEAEACDFSKLGFHHFGGSAYFS